MQFICIAVCSFASEKSSRMGRKKSIGVRRLEARHKADDPPFLRGFQVRARRVTQPGVFREVKGQRVPVEILIDVREKLNWYLDAVERDNLIGLSSTALRIWICMAHDFLHSPGHYFAVNREFYMEKLKIKKRAYLGAVQELVRLGYLIPDGGDIFGMNPDIVGKGNAVKTYSKHVVEIKPGNGKKG